ncbi:DUF3592 domain-containing protein [Corallococcus interemptor]|uniref:DUF3592 domain-containing protein n=1 Tax=Corallococcus interemptor TaxID=2316720 RepID=UPI003CFEAA52
MKTLLWGGMLFGLIFGFFAWRFRDNEQTWLSRPTVPGRMLAISLEEGRSKNNRYWYVKPRYAYEVDGKSYVGETLSSVSSRTSSVWTTEPGPELKATLERYPVGSTVTVHYNPRAPERSVLEVVTLNARRFGLIAGALVLCVVLSGVALRFVP